MICHGRSSHLDNMSEIQSPILFDNCSSFSTVGWMLLMTAAVSLVFSSFPFYTLINFAWKEYDAAVIGLSRAIKVYLIAFIATEMFGNMFVVPLFFIKDMQSLVCWPVSRSKVTVQTLCALSFCSYFSYKLLSMFLTTITGYSCLLHFNQSSKLYREEEFRTVNKTCGYEAQISLVTESSQSHQSGSSCESTSSSISRRRPLWFMLIFVVVLSIGIPSLPLVGLGPFNLSIAPEISTTLNNANRSSLDSDVLQTEVCTLFTFATPATEREYIFPLVLLMASGSCGLILIYILFAVLSGRIRSQEKFFEEVALLVSVQGLLFLATWLPVLVRNSSS